MAEMARTCFVIAPIGEAGSEVRRRSDQVFEYVIEPAVNECGYRAVRVDRIFNLGSITSQVAQYLEDADLVIANLTGGNPNVFYELGVREKTKKPVIQIIQTGESIPFDVATTRTIYIDHRDLDSAAACKNEIIEQIRSFEKDLTSVAADQYDSILSILRNIQTMMDAVMRRLQI